MTSVKGLGLQSSGRKHTVVNRQFRANKGTSN